MGLLSAGLAHELRNPANALVNALQPLLELLPAEERVPDSAGGQLSEVALEAANQIRQRSKSILEYSRAEKVRKQPEDVRVLLARVKRTLSTQLELVDTVRVDDNARSPYTSPLFVRAISRIRTR